MSSIANNTSTIKPSQPSIIVPVARKGVTQEQARAVFAELFGDKHIRNVVVDERRSTKTQAYYSRIFVHFTVWPKDKTAQKFRNDLINGETIEVIYDDPWFWKCQAMRPREKNSEEQTERRLELPKPKPITPHTEKAKEEMKAEVEKEQNYLTLDEWEAEKRERRRGLNNYLAKNSTDKTQDSTMDSPTDDNTSEAAELCRTMTER